LYNTVRLWSALGAGDSLVAGWMCKDPRELGIGVKGAPQEDCTVVCKDHAWREGTSNHFNKLFMSHRDPFYSVCSRKLMDVWCAMDQTGRKGPVQWDEVYAFKAKCKADPELEAKETTKQCRMLMTAQADIYYARQASNGQVAYDMLMLDYQKDPSTEVKNIALAMGICEEAATDKGLVEFVVAMGRELKAHPDKDMGITQMHDVHTKEQRKKKCSNLEEWMRSDEKCRKWMDASASYTANGVLQGMQAEGKRPRR